MRRGRTEEGVEAVNACIEYAYYTDGEEFARTLYGRDYDDLRDGGYVQGRFAIMRRDFARYWGSLDTDSRQRFFEAAITKSEAQEGKS